MATAVKSRPSSRPRAGLAELPQEDLRLYQSIPDELDYVAHPSFSLPATERRLFGREARQIIRETEGGPKIFQGIVRKAVSTARRFAGPNPRLTFHLFDFDGELLSRAQDEGSGALKKT